MSSPEFIHEHILSAEEQDELAHVDREAIDHARTFIDTNDHEFIEAVNRAANRVTGPNPKEKAIFIAGAMAVGGLMIRRMWHNKIEELTGKEIAEEPDS